MNSTACNSYLITWILITVGIIFQLCTCVTDFSWAIYDDAASGIVCPMDAIGTIQVSGAIGCGYACFGESNCTSFTFVDAAVGTNCYMMERDPSLLANCDPEPNAKHYMMVHSSFSCHPADENFRAYRMSDGGYLKYRIVIEWVDDATARSRCISTGGSLVKLSTVARMEFLQNLTSSCTAFDGTYRVGGSYDDVNAVWKRENGDPITITPTFWGPGEPDDPSTNQRLDVFNGGFYDIDPSSTRRYICEKP